MAKLKQFFVCQNCGSRSAKWLGRCPDCNEWNTFVEEAAPPAGENLGRQRGLGTLKAKAVAINQIESSEDQTHRISTGLNELDRVLGGGLVKGSFSLLGGDPGIGKSTLMLQILWSLAQRKNKVLYVSGEESAEQIHMRAKRLGTLSPDLLVISETNLESILKIAQDEKPELVVIDSIQTVFLPEIQSAPGSVSQVRESAARLMYLSKTLGVSVILIGHITKDGSIAGPKVLEHMVDTVLSFEGDPNHHFRILRGIKNRFGAAFEIGVFEMSSQGLSEVSNPSEIFLSERGQSAPGSAVFCTVEGSRPFLVEVQALAHRSNMAMPRRTTLGLDPNRIHLLLAIMDKHLGLDLYAHDVFVNVVGGIKIQEPAIDLAVAASLISSLRNFAIPKGFCFFGELGLTGEVRGVSLAEVRYKEAKKLGFERFFVPRKNKKHFPGDEKGVALLDGIQDLMDELIQ